MVKLVLVSMHGGYTHRDIYYKSAEKLGTILLKFLKLYQLSFSSIRNVKRAFELF